MPDDGAARVIRLVVQSDAGAVRAALQDLFGRCALAALPPADRGTAELVLAEVLNNIVEHAHPRRQGQIELTLCHTPQGLVCSVVDRGLRMPGGQLPEGRPMPSVAPMADLPEGGFGWNLIRLLATDLSYRRVGGRNELSFRLLSGQ